MKNIFPCHFPLPLPQDTEPAAHLLTLQPLLFFLLLLLISPASQADKLILTTDKPYVEPFSAIVPYAFLSESAGIVAGAAGAFSGTPQKQASLFVTALTSTNKAKAVFGFLNDYQLPLGERLFSSVELGLGDFPEKRIYFDIDETGTGIKPGSNESGPSDYFLANGYSDWFNLDLKYLLKTGHGKGNPINIYTLHNGLLLAGETGGGKWNPFQSGRSFIEMRLFYQDRLYVVDRGDKRITTAGGRLSLRYDNTDFPVNPARGSKLLLSISRDPGMSYTADSWTFAEMEFSKYFPLRLDRHSEQRVFAITAWTGNTLTWREEQGPDGLRIRHRPPPYYGATLGGITRLRAYPSERFSDRAVIYYGAEYRLIPKNDFLRSLEILEWLNFQWWELVAFAEAGRVAPKWDLRLLHTRMKSDLGLGVRVMAGSAIGRFDIAVSREQTTFWFMYGHPF